MTARRYAVAMLTALVFIGGASAGGPKRPDLRIMGPREEAPEQAPEVLITNSKDADEVAPVSPVLELNSYTFAGNVLRGPESQHASHWVVIFCPNWWEPCKNIEGPFAGQATEWQGRLNQDLLSSEVRFAKVDCATDKVLCNEQEVEGYPTINHYVGGARVAKWSGGQKTDLERFPKWLKKQFAAITDSSGLAAAGSAAGLQEVLSSYLVPGERAADIGLVLLGLAASFRLVLSNPELWAKGSPSAPSAGTAGTPTTSSSAAARVEASGGARLRQALPEEWRADRRSMEL